MTVQQTLMLYARELGRISVMRKYKICRSNRLKKIRLSSRAQCFVQGTVLFARLC